MKTFPIALQERYPQHSRIAERPWWHASKGERGWWLQRSPGEDGIVVDWQKPWNSILAMRGSALVKFPPNKAGITFQVNYCANPRNSISAVEGAVKDFGENYDAAMPMDTEADLMKLLERIDRERPLPHPGFRAGQVWAVVREGEGHSIVQLIEDYEQTVEDRVHPLERWFTTTFTGGNQISASLSSRMVHHLREDRLRELLASAFLIADPCCQHLAPWSPS
jgi:hypothetical protein